MQCCGLIKYQVHHPKKKKITLKNGDETRRECGGGGRTQWSCRVCVSLPALATRHRMSSPSPAIPPRPRSPRVSYPLLHHHPRFFISYPKVLTNPFQLGSPAILSLQLTQSTHPDTGTIRSTRLPLYPNLSNTLLVRRDCATPHFIRHLKLSWNSREHVTHDAPFTWDPGT